MQLLSPHLSLEELTFSSTAVAHGIDNTAHFVDGVARYQKGVSA